MYPSYTWKARGLVLILGIVGYKLITQAENSRAVDGFQKLFEKIEIGHRVSIRDKCLN